VYESGLLEKEIKQINDKYDKRKDVLIPKAEKKVEKKDKAGHSISTEYVQTKFERPCTYIIHGEKQREKVFNNQKEFEASIKDLESLKKLEINISLENYEKIIVCLENDVGNGEIIPKDRVVYLIESNFKELKLNEKQISELYDVSRTLSLIFIMHNKKKVLGI